MGKTINLPKKKDNKGRLCYLTTDGAKPYYIPIDVYKDAVNVGMNTHEELVGALKFNIIKYATRLGRKENNLEDLNKIGVYQRRLKEVLADE